MIQISEPLCRACGACVEVCPRQAIQIARGVAVIDEAACDDCGQCVPVCPTEAILRVDLVAPETAVGAVMVRETQPLGASPRTVARTTAIWPVVGAALLWAGREVLPRVADVALDVLARRAGGTSVSRGVTTARGAGRRGLRQRQRQRRKGDR